MELLELFRSENLAAVKELATLGFRPEVSEIGNLEHTAKCSVNVESDKLLANLTMWSSGECDLLVTNESADEVLCNESKTLRSEDEVRTYLDHVYRFLSVVNNRAS